MTLTLETFLDEIPELEFQLKRAVQLSDDRAIVDLCRRMRPLYAKVGAIDISRKCGDLESAATGNYSNRLEVFNLLREMIRFRSELYYPLRKAQ